MVLTVHVFLSIVLLLETGYFHFIDNMNEWLVKSLTLAKSPEDLVRAIEHLTSLWSIGLILKGKKK